MFFRKKCFFAPFLTILALSGCHFSTPPEPLPETPAAVFSPQQQMRAETFAKMLSKLKYRDIVIYSDEHFPDELANPEPMVKQLRLLGFNRVFVSIDSPAKFSEPWFNRLAAAAKKEGLRFGVILKEWEIIRRTTGGPIPRWLLTPPPDLAEMVRQVKQWNEKRPQEAAEVNAISVLFTPQCFTADFLDRPDGLHFTWGPDRFGPGLDNDLLVKRTIDILKQLDQIAEPIPVLPLIPDFFHDCACSGKLTRGKITEFTLNPHGKKRLVGIYDEGNVPSEAVKRVTGELRAAGAGAELSIAIYLADHATQTKGALRRRDWRDFHRAIDYAIKQFSVYPSFKGLIFGPFHNVELILEEK